MFNQSEIKKTQDNQEVKLEQLFEKIHMMENIALEVENLKAHVYELEEEKKTNNILRERIESLEKRVDHLENCLNGYENVIINLQGNNKRLDSIEQNMERYHAKIKKLEKSNVPSTLQQDKEIVVVSDVKEESYSTIDYFDFENHFRGSRELIKQRQKQYLSYFAECKSVIDIGCGRGEFLELLKENNIHAIGVDTYDEFVEYCKEKELEAVCDDGNHYLKTICHTDGIFVGQVVEHLQVDQIIDLCETAFEKLDQGGYFIIETPNPTSLAIYTHAFYIDPSHVKPVHPLTMEYFLQKAGFKDIQIVYPKGSEIDIDIPEINGEGIENIETFNKVMKEVSNMLFGSQDYAIIARK